MNRLDDFCRASVNSWLALLREWPKAERPPGVTILQTHQTKISVYVKFLKHELGWKNSDCVIDYVCSLSHVILLFAQKSKNVTLVSLFHMDIKQTLTSWESCSPFKWFSQFHNLFRILLVCCTWGLNQIFRPGIYGVSSPPGGVSVN